MQLPPEAIKKFQKFYYEDFGERISKEQAYDKLSRLIRLVKIVYYPKPKTNYKDTSSVN